MLERSSRRSDRHVRVRSFERRYALAAIADPAVAARVLFSGVFSGTLVMKLSSEVLPELTANMLGVNDKEEATLDQQYDALK